MEAQSKNSLTREDRVLQNMQALTIAPAIRSHISTPTTPTISNYDYSTTPSYSATPQLLKVERVVTEESEALNKAALERYQRDHNIVDSFVNDNYVSSGLADNMEKFKDVIHCSEYMNVLRFKNKSSFSPFYITKMADSQQWCDIAFTRVGKKQYADYELKGNAFKSFTDYAQPKGEDDLELATEPKGDLTNCILITAALSDIINTTPFTCGVVLGYKVKSQTGGEEFKPLEKRKYFYDAGDKLYNNLYHYVIPPKCNKSTEVNIYRSGFEVNEPIGAKYPTFNGNVDTLLKHMQTDHMPNRQLYAASPLHPCVEWLFANAASYPGFTLPELTADQYMVKEKEFRYAAQEFTKEFQQSVPIVDLSKLIVRIHWIDQGAVNKYYDSIDESNKLVAKGNITDSATRFAQLYPTDGSGGVAFSFLTEHIFREIV